MNPQEAPTGRTDYGPAPGWLGPHRPLGVVLAAARPAGIRLEAPSTWFREPVAWLFRCGIEHFAVKDALRREIHRLRAELEGRENPCEPRSGESYPRPAKGILVAMTVMVATLASSGRSAM
jgi:hypothetical protein